jgi:hypothetical protein
MEVHPTAGHPKGAKHANRGQRWTETHRWLSRGGHKRLNVATAGVKQLLVLTRRAFIFSPLYPSPILTYDWRAKGVGKAKPSALNRRSLLGLR